MDHPLQGVLRTKRMGHSSSSARRCHPQGVCLKTSVQDSSFLDPRCSFLSSASPYLGNAFQKLPIVEALLSESSCLRGSSFPGCPSCPRMAECVSNRCSLMTWQWMQKMDPFNPGPPGTFDLLTFGAENEGNFLSDLPGKDRATRQQLYSQNCSVLGVTPTQKLSGPLPSSEENP